MSNTFHTIHRCACVKRGPTRNATTKVRAQGAKQNAPKTTWSAKKTSFPGEKWHKQKQTQSKVVAKTVGDKHKTLEIPGKTRFFCRLLLPGKTSDKLPKNSCEKFGQHFPLQNYGKTLHFWGRLDDHADWFLRSQAILQRARERERERTERAWGKKVRVSVRTKGGTLTWCPRRHGPAPVACMNTSR